tara:strand:- start:991 stop:1488 length:498 start_codon:yes stop_codon:yes gene_type:complete
MPSRQKAKGNNFERATAKHLSDVFGLNFARVPTSGAMTGGLNADVLKRLSESQQLLLEGDLIPPDELRHLKIECKSHKNFSFAKLFSENKLVDDWILQAASDSKVWFLIFKINNKGNYVVFNDKMCVKWVKDSKRNFLLYKEQYYITSMDGFFEGNRDQLLNFSD